MCDSSVVWLSWSWSCALYVLVPDWSSRFVVALLLLVLCCFFVSFPVCLFPLSFVSPLFSSLSSCALSVCIRSQKLYQVVFVVVWCGRGQGETAILFQWGGVAGVGGEGNIISVVWCGRGQGEKAILFQWGGVAGVRGRRQYYFSGVVWQGSGGEGNTISVGWCGRGQGRRQYYFSGVVWQGSGGEGNTISVGWCGRGQGETAILFQWGGVAGVRGRRQYYFSGVVA